MCDFTKLKETLSVNHDARYKVFDNSMLVIPHQLYQVVMKMFPEILNFKISDVQSTLVYNPATFEPIEKFRLNLSVDIKPNQQPQGVKDYYSEEINKLFNFIYPDYEFVKFGVVEMTLVRPPSNRELFGRLFLPEQ
jgi:hypothetical protein